jgi:hypothetical protein
MIRMLRSDWQTKFTAHAHHQPFEYQGLSRKDDAIFASPQHERSPHVEILVCATRATRLLLGYNVFA